MVDDTFGSLIIEPEDFSTELPSVDISDLVSGAEDKGEGSGGGKETTLQESTQQNSVDLKLLNSFSKQLKEKGFIDLAEDEELKSPEDLLAKFDAKYQSEITNRFEEYKESAFSNQDKLYLKLREEGFTEDLAKEQADKINYYNELSDESLKDESTLEKIYGDYLRETTDFSEEEIAEDIATQKDLGKLESKVKGNLPKLLSVYNENLKTIKEEINKDKEAQLASVREFGNNLKNSVKSLQALGDLTIPAALRAKVEESISTPVRKDKFGNPISKVQDIRLKNPVAFETMLHTYAAAGLFDMDESGNPKPKFDLFKNIAMTKSTKELSDIFSKERNLGNAPREENNEFINKLKLD